MMNCTGNEYMIYTIHWQHITQRDDDDDDGVMQIVSG